MNQVESKDKIIAIVGLGLIGGSFAKAFKGKGFSSKIIGVDNNREHQKIAMEMNLVDEIRDLDDAIKYADIVLLATPVDSIEKLLPSVMNSIENQVVFDVGSTKASIIKSILNHPKRGRYVACHPMAGTEFLGPEASVAGLCDKAHNVIYNAEDSDEDALEMVQNLLSQIGMKLLYQQADEHDIHVSYLSHMSHISAFALALTVLHKEQSEEQIFQLASGGFRSSVRLAKSNPSTWVSIFEQNRDALLDVLDEHITVLSKFRSLLIKKDYESFEKLMLEANQTDIKSIIKSTN